MSLVNKDTVEVVCSPFSRYMHETVGRETGSMIITHMDFSWDEKLRDFIVVEGEKEDRQAYIDSFADECGVYNILKKYAMTGDVSLLNQRQGIYADISDLPVDDLDPAKSQVAAQAAVANLAEKLGVEITSDQLATLSVEEIDSLIAKAVEAKAGKVVDEKGEVNKNA